MKKVLLFASLLFNGMLFAQSNYQSGYVIKSNGDTLKGAIDEKEWTVSPKYIDFKANNTENKTTRFYPQNIKGFQVGQDENYLSYLGKISLNKILLAEITNNADTTKKIDTTFIKRVTTGANLSLYYQKDDIKIRYFVAEKGQQPIELQLYKRIKEDKESSNFSIATNAIYKGQLLLYATKFNPSNQKLTTKINNADYNQSDLERIINELNGYTIIIKKEFHFRSYLGAGINYNNTSFSGYSNSSITPKFDFGIDFFNNPKVQKIVLRFDFSFFYVTPKFPNYAIFSNSYSNTKGDFSFTQYNLTINPKILYNLYNKPNFKIYLGAGIGFNFANYSNNKITYLDDNNNPQITNNPFSFEKYYTTFPLEAGILVNRKIELNLSFTPNSPYSTYFYYYVTSNQITSLGVKYLFGN